MIRVPKPGFSITRYGLWAYRGLTPYPALLVWIAALFNVPLGWTVGGTLAMLAEHVNRDGLRPLSHCTAIVEDDHAGLQFTTRDDRKIVSSETFNKDDFFLHDWSREC